MFRSVGGAGGVTFDRVADFVLIPGKVPETALNMAATLLIDTVGVAAGAAHMQAGQIARDHAHGFLSAGSPRQGATLLFDGRRASIPGAAFATATQIDNLDAHDGYNPTKGHIGCAVVPALFAFAENRPELSSRDALAAMVMAYEVAARSAISLHATVSDYHTSGAWNALGVAALGARLLGSDAGQLRQALGIAEYHGPRSQMMREIANPTMLHDGSGMGALAGAMAALLAQQGFSGAPAITIEAEDVAPHWADLGKRWTIVENYIKPYPICRWAHAALDALHGLVLAHGFSAQDVALIEVNTFDEAAQLFGGLPCTTSQAQYSLPFALAVMLVHGRIGPEHISGAGLTDATVAGVVPRIRVNGVARHSDRFPAGRWSDIKVTLVDGTALDSGDVHARGGPEAPMDIGEVEVKFHAMTSLTLTEPRRAALWSMRDKVLNPGTRFEELARLTYAPAKAAGH